MNPYDSNLFNWNIGGNPAMVHLLTSMKQHQVYQKNNLFDNKGTFLYRLPQGYGVGFKEDSRISTDYDGSFSNSNQKPETFNINWAEFRKWNNLPETGKVPLNKPIWGNRLYSMKDSDFRNFPEIDEILGGTFRVYPDFVNSQDIFHIVRQPENPDPDNDLTAEINYLVYNKRFQIMAHYSDLTREVRTKNLIPKRIGFIFIENSENENGWKPLFSNPLDRCMLNPIENYKNPLVPIFQEIQDFPPGTGFPPAPGTGFQYGGWRGGGPAVSGQTSSLALQSSQDPFRPSEKSQNFSQKETLKLQNSSGSNPSDSNSTACLSMGSLKRDREQVCSINPNLLSPLNITPSVVGWATGFAIAAWILLKFLEKTLFSESENNESEKKKR
uniref:hypothetical protein n=1 Tax=Hydrocytium acuminatum TaxID=1745963 RepID=UPI002A832BDA|nr:hypothetical protein UYM18_pgp032 [Hydrocytium acuminatum]WOR09584.1 hypothetical protein [Hydrocytium acuminatum]